MPSFHGQGRPRQLMSRFLLLALGVVLLIVVGVAVILGAFPPSPHTEQVQRVLPNDKFAPQR